MNDNYFNNSLQPYGWQGVSKNVMDQAWLDAVRTNNRCYANQRKAEQDLKKEIVKSNLAEQREVNRNLSVKALIPTSNGDLCVENITPQGKITVSQPICNVRQIHAVRYASANKGTHSADILKIQWEGNPSGIYIAMDRKDLTAEVFRRLREKGVTLKIPRRLRAELLDGFISMLIEHAETVKVPEKVGWNQLIDGAWSFEMDPKRTMRGLNEND